MNRLRNYNQEGNNTFLPFRESKKTKKNKATISSQMQQNAIKTINKHHLIYTAGSPDETSFNNVEIRNHLHLDPSH